MASSRPGPVLRAEHIAKTFGQVTALTDVSLTLGRGEVLGLLGDNGAGKSTLMKIFTGFQQPTSGTLYFEGEPVHLRSVGHARALGIEAVYQDLALVNQLNVFENMLLQREPVRRGLLGRLGVLDRNAMRRSAEAALERVGVNIPSVDAAVSKLSGGQRQAIAVARSLYQKAKVLLLDEPTAAMGARESALILDLIQHLKEAGDKAIIVIAHNYAQIFDVCDRVNLIEGGRVVFDKPTAATSGGELTDIVVNRYRRARAGLRDTPAAPDEK
jgi:ABC-type sugar transport system ATPase subunit